VLQARLFDRLQRRVGQKRTTIPQGGPDKKNE
jgi:hypothetical protein